MIIATPTANSDKNLELATWDSTNSVLKGGYYGPNATAVADNVTDAWTPKSGNAFFKGYSIGVHVDSVYNTTAFVDSNGDSWNATQIVDALKGQKAGFALEAATYTLSSDTTVNDEKTYYSVVRGVYTAGTPTSNPHDENFYEKTETRAKFFDLAADDGEAGAGHIDDSTITPASGSATGSIAANSGKLLTGLAAASDRDSDIIIGYFGLYVEGSGYLDTASSITVGFNIVVDTVAAA